MRKVEHDMKKILMELSGYLKHQSMGDHVWDDILKLDDDLEKYLDLSFWKTLTIHIFQKALQNFGADGICL